MRGTFTTATFDTAAGLRFATGIADDFGLTQHEPVLRTANPKR